jgi:hypothetical protein
LDAAVEGFAGGVGDPLSEVAEHFVEVALKHLGLDRPQPTATAQSYQSSKNTATLLA